ncbi:glycosyltransferase family 4 protein [Paracoccus sp. p3-h83]|uniref:glycosyltransferase family 4 protein n=1 Tax=Paracoccus sp. p3-h83 TaxID=3342805 RepID=UPI0035BBEB89
MSLPPVSMVPQTASPDAASDHPPLPGAGPRRAAIYFATDGYDPGRHGINGRRVAGQSFLTGYLTHMGDGPALACVDHQGSIGAFQDVVRRVSPGRAAAVVLRDHPRMAGIGTLFYPAPSLARLAWQRQMRGQTAWANCGLTHTTATAGVQAEIAAFVTAPVAPWDALITTSLAVRASVIRQLEVAEDFARRRFPGAPTPERPLIQTIPLGIDTAAFAPDPVARAALRAELGLGDDAVLVACLSRLSFNEKFDPLPAFIALARAQGRCRAPLHLALIGQFADTGGAEDFRRAAQALMPDVALHLIDGASRDRCRAGLSAADIFLFPIDNVQETFGLAPVEAMAAGLPVVATDWDGLRDTVTPQTGILIPTLAARAVLGRKIALRFLLGQDDYHHYLAQTAAQTVFDVDAMARALADLADAPDLRARLGSAGRARAQAVFDWAAVVPRMQDLWAEQDARRRAAIAAGVAPFALGADVAQALPPHDLFASYPSGQITAPARFHLIRSDAPLPDPQAMAGLRRFDRLRRPPAVIADVTAVLAALPDGDAISLADLATRAGLDLPATERAAIWLMKYGYAHPA